MEGLAMNITAIVEVVSEETLLTPERNSKCVLRPGKNVVVLGTGEDQVEFTFQLSSGGVTVLNAEGLNVNLQVSLEEEVNLQHYQVISLGGYYLLIIIRELVGYHLLWNNCEVETRHHLPNVLKEWNPGKPYETSFRVGRRAFLRNMKIPLKSYQSAFRQIIDEENERYGRNRPATRKARFHAQRFTSFVRRLSKQGKLGPLQSSNPNIAINSIEHEDNVKDLLMDQEEFKNGNLIMVPGPMLQ